MLWEFSVFIFTLAFLIFAVFSVLYLLQLRRTAKNIEIVLNSLNQSLPGILTKIDSIAGDVSETVRIIRTEASGLSNASQRIQEMANDALEFERTLRSEIEVPVMQILSTYHALIKGVRTFIATLIPR